MRKCSHNLGLGIVLLPLLLLMAGCRIDDDSNYAIRTYSNFFLVEKPDGRLSIYQYRPDEHVLDSAWNEKVGIPSADLSDATMVDNLVWVASGPQKVILQVSPTFGSTQERFGSLPLAPHFIAVGEKQVLVADTAAGKVAFVKRRNGDVQEIAFTGKPGMCIYNSGKFYLQVNDSAVAVYDESALSPRSELTIGLPVDELLLNRYHAILVITHDSASTYRVLIDPNADYLIGQPEPVFYSKIRPTPYFSVRFGEEFLRDLQLSGGNLIDEQGTVVADSIADFEADFFEGTVFYTRGQDFVVKSIADLTTVDSLSFQGRFIKSFHQYAPE
jgi:hypothetical protein